MPNPRGPASWLRVAIFEWRRFKRSVLGALLELWPTFGFGSYRDHAVRTEDVDNNDLLLVIVEVKPVPAFFGWVIGCPIHGTSYAGPV